MWIENISAPANYPVALEEVKDHLRLIDENEDATLHALLAACTEVVQNYLNCRLITQTVKVHLNCFGELGDGADGFRLPVSPVQSITQIRTFDDSDVATVWDSSNYRLSGQKYPRIDKRQVSSWPTVERVSDGIEVTAVVGYGDDWNAVPESIRHAIKIFACHYYENRDVMGMPETGTMPIMVEALLDRHRFIWIA